MRNKRGAMVPFHGNALDNHGFQEPVCDSCLKPTMGQKPPTSQIWAVRWQLRRTNWHLLGGLWAAAPLSPAGCQEGERHNLVCALQCKSCSLTPVDVHPYFLHWGKPALTNCAHGAAYLQTKCCSPFHQGRIWKRKICWIICYPNASKDRRNEHRRHHNTDSRGRLLHNPFPWQTLSYIIAGQCLYSSLGK